MNDEALKALGHALSEAQVVWTQVRNEKIRWIDEREDIIAKQAAELFDLRITEARQAVNLAQILYNDARVAAAAADTGWLPVGTRVWRLEKVRYGPSRTLQGIVEVWSHTSARPENRTYHPDPGTVVVRLLKANGEPSLMYDDRLHQVTHNGWQEVK